MSDILDELRQQADRIHRRYVANYAGQPRISRDPDALDRMAKDLDVLAAELRRLPREQQTQLGRVLRENRDLYIKEAKAIRDAQAGGAEALYAHHLATWAALTSARYRRNFAGKGRSTRDVGLLSEMITDLERLVPLMEEQLSRVPSPELRQALQAARENVELYTSEQKQIGVARGAGTLEQQADTLANVANRQFALYRLHFAGKSRVSRRPALLERMITNLVTIHDRMQSLAAQGFHAESNDKNADIVKGRINSWRQELEAIREAKSVTSLDALINALGEAANDIFAEYREHYAGKDRASRDLDQLDALCEGLLDLARQMDDLDRVRDDDTNRHNLGVVIDHLRMYGREWEAIREAQPTD